MEGGHREVLSLLIRAGCDPDYEHRLTGRRPLYTAALGGQYKIMRVLIEAGADKDARINLGRGRSGNFTALHAAAELGGVDSVSVLVEKNAFLEARSDADSTPLHLAASAGAIDTVMILANAGADIGKREVTEAGSWGQARGRMCARPSLFFCAAWYCGALFAESAGL